MYHIRHFHDWSCESVVYCSDFIQVTWILIVVPFCQTYAGKMKCTGMFSGLNVVVSFLNSVNLI